MYALPTLYLCVYIYLKRNSDLWYLQQKVIGFINEMKSVYSAVQTGSLNKAFCTSSCSAHTVLMYFVFIWEQTATCATYSINWLVFITVIKSVYSVVRTGSLNKAVCASSCSAHTVLMCFVFIWEQTETCASYSINWLVFITEMKSVYSAVRTESLNKAFCASSLKG
jgi:uncharacterized MnhB-related membrane protein